MTRLLIDVTRLVGRFKSKRLPTGVDRVGLAYIQHYGPQARAVLRYNGGKFVFRQAESASLFAWLLAIGKRGSPLPIIYKGLVSGCLSQNVSGCFLFNTGHSGLESENYPRMLQSQQVKPIFMVHDLIPITHPQFCRTGERDKHLARMRHTMQVARGLVCNSQATLDAVSQLCEAHKWQMPPATVALLATDLPAVTHTAKPLEQAYFVFISTIEPRKNHMLILRVWQKLAITMGADAPRLVIIGQRGWNYTEVTDLLEKSDALKRLVTEVSTCSDATLVTYVKHAQALLFPSFAEGYGMPVVEALSLGTPVIASNLPVFREFAGTVPVYLPADDEAQWADMIANFSAPKSLERCAQLKRLDGFIASSWCDHFKRVDMLLDEISSRETSHA